jgi:hypothetical protein
LDDRSDPGKRASRPGASEGRSARVEQLRQQLSSAPLPYLEGALENPALGEEEMVLLLRNLRAGPALLQRIGRDHRWTRSYEIKKGLVQHPRTPQGVSSNLLPHLYWRELVEVSGNLRAPPVVRRHAEALIEMRLEEMSLGERVALARRASRGLVGRLIEMGEARVMQGLLGNPRLVERDAIRVASSGRVSAGLLSHLARHPKWGPRREVRLALLRNARTPVPAALGLLGMLSRRDLRRLAGDENVPRIVRVGAERRLGSERPRIGQRPGRE